MPSSCSCCIERHGIRYCAARHRYTHIETNRELVSVSSVIKTVYSKKSYDGKEDETPEEEQRRLSAIENANIRGTLVDGYLTDYIINGPGEVPANEREDVKERFAIARRIFEENYGSRVTAEAQVIVYSLDDGVAGTTDVVVDGSRIIDWKATYQPELSWKLQLGAYATYLPAQDGAIVHISPSFYRKSGGGKLLKVNIEECKKLWRDALIWWKCISHQEQVFRKEWK